MSGPASSAFDISIPSNVSSDMMGQKNAFEGNSGIAPLPQAGSPVLSPTAQQSFGNAITYGIPGLGAGLVDTLGQSLGVFHNDTVPDALKAISGNGENSFGDFYSRNQQPLRTGGEIAGMLLPGLAAMKLLKTARMAYEGSALADTLGDSIGGKAMDILLGNSADLTAKESAIAKAAAEGTETQGVWAGRSINTPAMIAAKRSYYVSRAVDAVRTSVAFDLGNRVAFNSSDTFYPADYTLTDQLKWTVAGTGGFIAIDAAMAKYAVRSMVQTAIKSYTTNAQEYGTVAPTVAGLASVKDADKTIFRPNQRGLGITQYAAMSSDLEEIAKLNGSATLKTNLAQDQVNIKGIMTKQIGMMGYDTHPILPRTTLTPAQIDLAITATKKNNTALLSANKLANVPADGAANFYDDLRKTHMDALYDFRTQEILAQQEPDPMKGQAILDAAAAKFKPIETAANEMHYVLENDGRFTVYKNRADNWLDQNGFEDIKAKTYKEPDPENPTGPGIKNFQFMAKGDNDLILHNNFRAEIPASASPLDYSALYAMGSKMISEGQIPEGMKYILTPQLDWRTIEGTLALAEANPSIKSAIKLGNGFASLDDAAFHVINQKFKGFMADMPNTSAQPVTGFRKLIASQNLTPAEVIQKYNLPEGNGLTPSPLIETFAHAKLQGMTDLNDMFPVTSTSIRPADYTQMDLLQAHLRETAGITDNTVKIPTQGVLLKQKDIKPIFVAASSTPMPARSDAMIAGQVQAMRDIQLENLAKIGPNDSPLVSGVIKKIITPGGTNAGDLSGAANTARAVQTLQDGLVSGTGQVVYQERINEQFPTLKAAQLLAQDTDAFAKAYVGDMANARGLTPKLANILSLKNRADLLDYNRIEQSYRHGWDIKGFEPDPTGSGGMVARLSENSLTNSQLANNHFSEIPEDMQEFMPDMSVTALKSGYQPLVVSKAAADVATTISEMSKQSGRENNALRNALGKNPIKIRDFHLPTPELSKQNAWFVRNDVGNVIAAYGSADAKANMSAAQDVADTLNKNFPGTAHTAVPLDMVQRDHMINDDAFFHFIDYSDQLRKTGAAIKGGLAHAKIDTTDTTIKAATESLVRQFLNIGIRSRAAVFEPELNYARQAAVAGAATGTRDNFGKLNIFDRYLSTMFSRNPTTSIGDAKGTIQGFYRGTEGVLDRALSFMNANYTELTGNQSSQIAAKAMRTVLRTQSSEEEFKSFQKTLPDWSPIQNIDQWAENTFKEKPAWAVPKVMTTMTRTASTLLLRFFDVGMSVIHLSNFATNAPAVVASMRKLPTESIDQWINRTAAWGTRITGDINTFSPLKAMNNVSRAYWAGELTGPMTEAAKQGYFTPEIASLTKLLTSPARTKAGGYFNTFNQAAVYLADHSEIMAKKMAWGMGYKIGKELHGFTDEKNAYIYANNFMNEVIGNYSPNNKPAIFAGSIGQPLGAFQTYMTNFYRRMFNYLETGNKSALLTQYAAQAGVFGAKSVPGFHLWNKMFQSNADGSDDFEDRINKRFAPGVGELILNGSLANIPKIWGLQNDGFSWNTRGAADYTEIPSQLADLNLTAFGDTTRNPTLALLAKTMQGISETASNIFSNEGFSVQQQEEILSRMTTNRALKHIMEMAADVKTDDRGRVIQYGTRDAIHLAANLLGTDPESTQQLQDASARERLVQLNQEDARATLNDKTMSLFRSGKFDTGDLQNIVSDYLKSGGNPGYLGQWFRNTIASSMTPKAMATMQQLGSSGKMLEFENMLAALQQNPTPNAPTIQPKGRR